MWHMEQWAALANQDEPRPQEEEEEEEPPGEYDDGGDPAESRERSPEPKYRDEKKKMRLYEDPAQNQTSRRNGSGHVHGGRQTMPDGKV